MDVNEYRKILHEDIMLSCSDGGNERDEFLNYATFVLANAAEFDDFVECHFEGVSRRNGNMKIDGYSFDETDGSWCFFIVDYRGGDEDSINADDVNSAFRKIRLFVEESIKNKLYAEFKGSSQLVDCARDLYYDSEKITKIRFYLLTDTFNKQRAKTLKDERIGNITIELNVWDISRLYGLVCSQTQKESIEIEIPDFGFPGIPCVKAVDYKNIIADIDISPSNQFSNNDSKPENIITYSSYLAVVPGQLLNDLYLEYGSRLLEGNVRSFLSVRGKVNKSIQSTIKNYPEMFFAYNNGIAATATDIDTEMSDEGLRITRIKDLQIVNGGQTTASIANTLLNAKKNENIRLEHLYVPMKISVLEHSMSERIIPKISEYSNSQNKVDASDFFSNHPFHIRMEEYSRKTPIPSINGNQFLQYWFYERARGQYNQGKMKLKGSELKQYANTYPEKQVITMLDLAKYMELYFGSPNIVSKGKQKMLQVFAERIKSDWDKNNTEYNELYFKRVIAIAIIYKKTDEYIKQTDWYKEKKSYKANVIAYTIGLLFEYIRKFQKKCELDFARIWNEQDIYEELADQIAVLTKEVYLFITGPRDTENVTEWCKKESCWEKAKDRDWTFLDPFIYTLVSKDVVKDVVKDEKENRKIANEINMYNEIYERGESYWTNVYEWGTKEKLLTPDENKFIRMTINFYVTYRPLNEHQMNVVMKARKKLIENGMPLQFN